MSRRIAGACGPISPCRPSPPGCSRCTAATSWTRTAAPSAVLPMRRSRSMPAPSARSSPPTASPCCSATAPRRWWGSHMPGGGGWPRVCWNERSFASAARLTICWCGWAPPSAPGPSKSGTTCARPSWGRTARPRGASVAGAGGRWLADLYGLARLRLRSAGVHAVHGGGVCTFSDATRFYSYRRDGATGRMASLLWLEPAPG